MHKLKILILSSLIFSSVAHAATPDQARLAAKCASVSHTSLMLSAITQSISSAEAGNIALAFAAFSTFSASKLGEPTFFQLYEVHDQKLSNQLTTDILAKGQYQAILSLDRQLIAEIKTCTALAKFIVTPSETSALNQFNRSDEGKQLTEKLRQMLQPKNSRVGSIASNQAKPDPKSSEAKPLRRVDNDLGVILENAERDYVQPAYREAQKNTLFEGSDIPSKRVVVYIEVAPSGNVSKAEFKSTELNDPVFEQKIIDIIQGLKFESGNFEAWNGWYEFIFPAIAAEQMSVNNREIRQKISNNWRGGADNYKASARIRYGIQGNVISVQIIESNNNELDASLIAAINRSSPLPVITSKDENFLILRFDTDSEQ